jgi:hypothetical protein
LQQEKKSSEELSNLSPHLKKNNVVTMTVINRLLLFVLFVTLIGVAGAKPLAGGSHHDSSQTNVADPKNVHRFFPGLVFLYKLSQGVKERTKHQRHIPQQVLVIEYKPVPKPETNTSTPIDPNIVLLLQHFEAADEEEFSALSAERPTRDMSIEDESENNRSFFDLLLVPRRKWPDDQMTLATRLSPPPPSPPVAINKVGRSISTADMGSNQPYHSEISDDESPDFLSTLVTIPQVWMHDLSQMIIQPLRKDKNPLGERDSFEYFG